MAVRLERFLDEFKVERVHLVIVLRLLGLELDVQRDLIALIHHAPVARNHFADVKILHPGNPRKVMLRARHEFFGGGRLFRKGPKDDDVGKHRAANLKA